MLAYRQNDVFILIGVYIDNFLLAFQSQDKLEWLQNWFIKEFNKKDLSRVKIIIG